MGRFVVGAIRWPCMTDVVASFCFRNVTGARRGRDQ
jgi:hypothetical protein